MGAVSVVLLVVRVMVMVAALAIVGLSAWAKILIHDMEVRGESILSAVLLRPEAQDAWRKLFEDAVTSQLRIWVTMAAACFTFLTTLLIVLSHRMDSMRMSPYLANPLEFITMLSMAAAFGATLSLTLKLGSPALTTAPAPELGTFAMLIPLSKAYAITAGGALFLLLTSWITSLVQTCHRVGDSKACSFEPTASTLGIDHGYQAPLPRTSRGPIPTFYDPSKPMPDLDKEARVSSDEEKGLIAGVADLGRVDSMNGDLGDDKAITGPLGLKKPDEVANMRPARPWSEALKRR